jgi:hypothetical protein
MNIRGLSGQEPAKPAAKAKQASRETSPYRVRNA